MTPTPTLFSVTVFACVTCLVVATLASQTPMSTPGTPDCQRGTPDPQMRAVLDEHAQAWPQADRDTIAQRSAQATESR